MIWILFIVALIIGIILIRLPVWLSGSLVALVFLFIAALTSAGGLDRVLSPALLIFMSIFLFVPNASNQISNKIAPSNIGRKKSSLSDPGERAHIASGSPFDAIDIAGYQVLEKVGSGGMASVYRAKRQSDNEIVALKIPMEQYVADAKFIRRFHREAEVAQRLDHKNIVRTYEHGSLGVKHYMVMEFVDGRSLEGFIESGDLNINTTIEVMKLVVDALQHIHSAGIIHRDIKPANIMVLREGIKPNDDHPVDTDAVKLMDFGIAGGKVLTRLTMTGARVGTPVYMSPEQARGLKIDHRSDIYSLGLVFYEMLTGQTAFKGGYEAIVHQQIFQTPPPPRQINLAIPKELDALVMRMISKDADDRPSLQEVTEILSKGDFQDSAGIELRNRILLTVSARQGVLRILDREGNLHTSLGDIGVGEGRFAAAPLSMSVDSQGSIYAAIFEYRVGQDTHEMIHKLSHDGQDLLTFGGYGMQPGEFLYPVSISVAPDDSVYVLDSETHLVQHFDSEGQYMKNFGGRGSGQGTFNDPRMIATDHNGFVYVLDYGNRQVQRFDPEGRYQTRWAFKLGADKPGTRELDGITVDGEGNLYISDATGRRIRKITPEGKIALSYAVDALQGEAMDALLDLGVDDEGFLYAARRGGHLIRKYDEQGRLLSTMETYAPVVQMIIDSRPETPTTGLLLD